MASNTTDFTDEHAKPAETSELTEEQIWQRTGPMIWKAKRFVSRPSFYPVYRFDELYSYSPLALIRYKRRLRLNPQTAIVTERTSFNFCPNHCFVDQEINRVGGPTRSRHQIRSRHQLIDEVAAAMVEDTAAAEEANPDTANIVLCGGRDSLNLLLLPWKHDVVVASAPPNDDYVRQFIEDNGLPYEVVSLRDDCQDVDSEVMINCCRNNLMHCRWGGHLQELAQRMAHNAIFWKGQLGDVVLTEYWETYGAITVPLVPEWLASLYSKIGSPFQWKLRSVARASGKAEQRLRRALWNRGAMWQGSHVGFLRELTGCLVLSGYHGEAMQSVLSRVHISKLVDTDIRAEVGNRLKGGTVRYPDANPGPPISKVRGGFSTLSNFLESVKRVGIDVV